MKVLVLGASTNPERYSYLAINSLRRHNHEVIAVGNKKGRVADVEIVTEKQHFENIHTVTLYLGAKNQTDFINYIIDLKPKRIIFNPGTENYELENLAIKNNIETVTGCTLVMLSSGVF